MQENRIPPVTPSLPWHSSSGALPMEQEKVLELARPQLALVPLGYSVSLLLWDPRGPGTQLPFQSVIWQVIDAVFQELEALGDATRSLQMVSLVQVSSHDKAWDLLRPDGRALQVMDVAPLGLMVEEATEVAVPDAQAALSAYARGLGAIPALLPLTDRGSAVQGAGSLFTLTVERELQGGRRQRSALRILVSPGASRPCPSPECREPGAVCLPWIVERLLEGNSLTFLLLCVSLPDTSREEILGALGLAGRVKGLARTISATVWEPEEEIAARRREMRALRTELLAGSGRPEHSRAVAQLQRALRELQVLKSQRWEKKKAVAKVLGTSEMDQPSTEDQVSAGNTAPGQQPGTQTAPSSARLEPEHGARHASRNWVQDMWAQSMALHGQGDSRSQEGDSQALVSTGKGLLEEPFQSKVSQPRPGCDSAGSRCQPCPPPEVQRALARAQRQRLRAQHCRQLQRELGAATVRAQEHRGEWDAERWQREVTALGLSLEAALREREAAEWHLEALLHWHRREMQACRQHLLQVLRGQQRLAEEQRAALERRHRARLQEALRDAAELAEHSQRLRDTPRARTAHATTQSP
ncbi:uncharacterized protein LOC120498611 [Passer montanus]|uniref:uncharacterized protein LOC120498611 n=1 Tax=Passer montanus TaxID=9160 RepID=UPI00195F4B57|nr:uncharacterized protein LOC120498611 [Passer montanus]